MGRPKKQHLAQRPDGRYACYYHGKYFYGYTEDEALQAREDYKDAEKKGNVFRPDVTVQEYALHWLPVARPAVSKSTYRGLAIHLEKLCKAIGNEPLADVKPSQIRQVYSTYYKNLSNKYILNGKQLYVDMFDSAVSDGICRVNPCREKAAKPHKGAKPKERVLSKQERIWIETLCTDHRAWPAVMAMLYAGVRPQEMKAIDIDRDVDFENDTITVQETAHLDGQKYEYNEEMKTDWSKRVIPLFPPLKEALTGKHGYLIKSAHGERVTIQTWKVAWNSYKFSMETAINGIQKRWYGRTKEHKKILDDGGKLPEWIPFEIVPYTLRHAFCTMCRDNHVDINTCRKWMGHADAQMILKVYDSVSDDRNVQERKKIDEIFQKPDQKP